MRELSDTDIQRIRQLMPGQSMKDFPEHLWHDSFRRRAYRRVQDGTPTERRGGAPYGLRRLHGDQPSKTITSAAITEFVHPTQNRFLTLRECARVQTFPDDLVFCGTVGQIATQIGNAVPPGLGEIFARTLRCDLVHHWQDETTPVPGALLSFMPTSGSGMSPALQAVCERVALTFTDRASQSSLAEQLSLWR